VSRKALFAAAVAIGAGLFPIPASADTFDVFDLSGFTPTCFNGLSCPSGLTFSGTITINVTTGTITAVNLAASVVSPPNFTSLTSGATNGTTIIANQLSLPFDTIALQASSGSLFPLLTSPPSLITSVRAFLLDGPTEQAQTNTATLTLETPTAVPIPAVGLPGMLFVLIGGGLLDRWRRRQKIA
jgi:hypothetical protein